MPFGMTRIFLGLIARHTLATDLPIYESFYETVATISALCAVSYIIWVKTRITIWTVCHNDSPSCGTKNRTCAIHTCCSSEHNVFALYFCVGLASSHSCSLS